MKRSLGLGVVTLKAIVLMPSPRCSSKQSAPAATRTAAGRSGGINSLISLLSAMDKHRTGAGNKRTLCPQVCFVPGIGCPLAWHTCCHHCSDRWCSDQEEGSTKRGSVLFMSQCSCNLCTTFEKYTRVKRG